MAEAPHRCAVQLAPAPTLRMASWPVDVLDGFADEALAEAAIGLDDRDPVARASFATHYDRAMQRHQQRLVARTVEDPVFMRALAVANPPLAKSAQQLRAGSARIKKIRHLETSLYRHLARAAGRPVPGDLWASVGLVQWGPAMDVTSQAPCVVVAPDLQPFRAIIEQLARRPDVRRHAPWITNPTLTRRPDGRWTFGVPGAPVRALRPSAQLDALLGILHHRPPATLVAWQAELGSHPALADADVAKALDACVELGVLVGGLSLPRSFSDPWEALRTVGPRLPAELQPAWLAAVERLTAIADQLADGLHDASVAQIVEWNESAGSIVQSLAASVGVEPPPLPRAMLRCDVTPPLRLTLGPDQGRAVKEALTRYLAFQGRYGLGPALLERALEPVATAETALAVADAFAIPLARMDQLPITWEAFDAWLAPSGERPLAARIAHHEALLAMEGSTHDVDRLPSSIGPPFGTLLLGFADGDLRTPVVHGTSDHLTAVFARHVPLLRRAFPMCSAALERWVPAVLHAVAPPGVAIADLRVGSLVPNTQARPEFCSIHLDPWNADPRALDLRDATMHVDAGRHGARIRLRSGQDVVAVPLSSANQATDPLCRALLLTGFVGAPIPELRAGNLVFERELTRGRPSARITLGHDVIARARRTVLAGPELRALLALPRAARFARWVRLAREHGWPPLVRVHVHTSPPVLMPTLAPLALEALLEGARERTRVLAIEAPEDVAWITTPRGERHVAELAVPFVRSEHWWNTTAPARSERLRSSA